MANEDKKDFNAMLHDSKDMPKFQTITDQKSIEKYGGSRMYFAPPIDYDKVMKLIPYGKVITVGKIREYFAELNTVYLACGKRCGSATHWYRTAPQLPQIRNLMRLPSRPFRLKVTSASLCQPTRISLPPQY